MVASSCFAVYQNWMQHLVFVRSNLVFCASMTSALIDSTLLDASKLLDRAQLRITEDLRHGAISPITAHNSLERTVSDFHLFNSNDLFGLLFFMSGDGQIVAQNDAETTPAIDISDRLYYQALKNNPNLAWSIGNEVIARTNNARVFHLASPILDRRNELAGLVVQQIRIGDITDKLGLTNASPEVHVQTLLPNNQVVFSFDQSPNGEAIPPLSTQSFSTLSAEKDRFGAIVTDSSEGSILNGYAKSPQFGLITVASISFNTIFHQFLRANALLASFTILAVCVISFLFLKLYKQTVDLEHNRMLSVEDPLSGLNNRRALDDALPKLMLDAAREKKPISVLFIDIDHFKIFNDHYGHEKGDEVIKAISVLIKRSLSRPLDFCCRWGGEEFAVVLLGTDEAGAVHVAKKILKSVQEIKLEFVQSPLPQLTVSIGIASISSDMCLIGLDLIDMADKAMFAAKQNGRNQFHIFSTQPKCNKSLGQGL